MAKSPEAQTETMIRNLETQTGKPFAHWLRIARGSKRTRHGEIVAFLKTEHGLGHGYANLVVHRALVSDATSAGGADALIAAQYQGAKAGLKPIYDAVLAAVTAFGDDVAVSPKKAYVSLRRAKQFAMVQPATATRMDVGLNLKGVAVKGRLEAVKQPAMCSHVVRVTSAREVDQELVGLLRKAYDAS